MTDLRKAAQDLLNCYVDLVNFGDCGYSNPEQEKEVIALRQALAQPEQEPVAWLNDREEMYFDKEDAFRNSDGFIQPLYTAPPKREWVGLTDEELPDGATYEFGSGACWAAAKLKEKNT